MSRSSHKSLNALMRHIRASSGIDIHGSAHKRALAQMGYFHGYKGYRFSRSPSQLTPFSDFDEICAVFSFDAELKVLFYPLLMRLEMTMKNLALVELLDAADSSALADVYKRLMLGSTKKGLQGKLEVIHSGDRVLLERYSHGDRIVTHYYDGPGQSVPLWALFEVTTLGHFARFLEQLSPDVLVRVAGSWGVRRGEAQLVPHLVFAITELRNAVAHNGIVFDTRFASAKVRKQVGGLIGRELGFAPALSIDFRTITDYLALVAYLAVSLGFAKKEVYQATKRFSALSDELRSRVHLRVFDEIVHTDSRAKLQHIDAWVRAA